MNELKGSRRVSQEDAWAVLRSTRNGTAPEKFTNRDVPGASHGGRTIRSRCTTNVRPTNNGPAKKSKSYATSSTVELARRPNRELMGQESSSETELAEKGFRRSHSEKRTDRNTNADLEEFEVDVVKPWARSGILAHACLGKREKRILELYTNEEGAKVAHVACALILKGFDYFD
ncbi:hypothetical protein Tco_0278700 [Tanacetum coccineum]